VRILFLQRFGEKILGKEVGVKWAIPQASKDLLRKMRGAQLVCFSLCLFPSPLLSLTHMHNPVDL
jgi:hypothetical protein